MVALLLLLAVPPVLQRCSDLAQKGPAEPAVAACKEAVIADPQSAAAHQLLGQAYLLLGRANMVAEAKAELQQALDLEPRLLWARFYLARVYLDIGRADKAKEELAQALHQRPGVAHFLSLMGEAERKQSHFEQALDWQRQALAADPQLNTAHYYAALAYLDLKRNDEAVAELEAAVTSAFLSPDILLTLGSQYVLRKRYREAEQLCRKAIALDPSRSESYLNLGQLFNAQRHGDRALEALRQALPEGKIFGSSPYYQKLQADVWFEMGRAWEIRKNPREARAAYQHCLHFDSARADARQRLEALK
jgi:tetratricopeptide (TPR) repeat protein